jgi:hypothetical protein
MQRTLNVRLQHRQARYCYRFSSSCCIARTDISAWTGRNDVAVRLTWFAALRVCLRRFGATDVLRAFSLPPPLRRHLLLLPAAPCVSIASSSPSAAALPLYCAHALFIPPLPSFAACTALTIAFSPFCACIRDVGSAVRVTGALWCFSFVGDTCRTATYLDLPRLPFHAPAPSAVCSAAPAAYGPWRFAPACVPFGENAYTSNRHMNMDDIARSGATLHFLPAWW